MKYEAMTDEAHEEGMELKRKTEAAGRRVLLRRLVAPVALQGWRSWSFEAWYIRFS